MVVAHQRLVGSIALAMSGDVASSEDIAQEVFLHVWTGLHRLTRTESFLPWLRELTRNRARDFLRRRGRRHEVLGAEGGLLLGQSAAPSADVEATLIRDQQAARLAAALDALPEESREVVILYYREGRSTAQVAKLLDLSETAVRKRLARDFLEGRIAPDQFAERLFAISQKDPQDGHHPWCQLHDEWSLALEGVAGMLEEAVAGLRAEAERLVGLSQVEDP